MRNKLRKWSIAALVTLFWLSVWAGGCYVANRTLLLPLPYPWDVAQVLCSLLTEGAFWSAVAVSLFRVVIGFAAAVVAGILLAMLTTRFKTAHALLAPVLSVVRAAPVASFIFVVFLWIRAESIPVFISFVMVVPLVWENVRSGILNTDSKLLEMAHVFRLSLKQRFWQIRLPAVRPYLQAAVTTGFGFAWKAGVAAEILCWPSDSLGYYIAAAKSEMLTAEVFAVTTVVIVLSVLLERLLRLLIHRREVAQ